MDKTPNSRCYLRGLTPLGLFNTLAGCLFNRVLVRHTCAVCGRTLYWSLQKAEAFPPTDAPAPDKERGNLFMRGLLWLAGHHSQVITLRPDDILVLYSPLVMSARETAHVAAALQQLVDNPVLIVDEGKTLGVIRRELAQQIKERG
ncbi:MAG: hypothetical protein M1546_00325 [Chloroflexi bacterium]|nr:hypothetical protein [Chloroflexota bacterium]